MAEVRDQQRRQRAEGRDQRRAGAEQPRDGGSGAGRQLKHAAVTAAAAALAGALAGGAKALADKRGRPQPDSEPESWGLTPEGSDPSRSPEPEPPEPEPAEEAQEQSEPEAEGPEHGAASGDVAEIIERAREHVEGVLGSEAESVSGIQRSNGHWCVTVEVVQLRRVPESTDVLASYAVVVDDDGGLISLQQTRRYRRSQADDGR